MTTPWHIEVGDCIDVLRSLPDDSVDSMVTDPPAGIAFMGKDWDKDKGGRDAWVEWMTAVMREAMRVLKPGAHALVWALPRTSHWTARAVEDAGFEVRDVLTHLFGSGFPKSLDVSKAIDKDAGHWRGRAGAVVIEEQPSKGTEYERTDKGEPITAAAAAWAGWGTALKPSSEHWILARKPLVGTVAANVLEHGTGGINVDATRVAHASPEDLAKHQAGVEAIKAKGGVMANSWKNSSDLSGASDVSMAGRWPPNTLLSHADGCEVIEHKHGVDIECVESCPVAELDAQSGTLKSGSRAPGVRTGLGFRGADGDGGPEVRNQGGASRFFPTFRYQAKPSAREREMGCESLPKKSASEMTQRTEDSAGLSSPRAGAGRTSEGRGNHHPTVKSVELMRWLVRLVTPMGGLVLDPFAGSGSTGCAAVLEAFAFLGIEQSEEYAQIARARIGARSP